MKPKGWLYTLFCSIQERRDLLHRVTRFLQQRRYQQHTSRVVTGFVDDVWMCLQGKQKPNYISNRKDSCDNIHQWDCAVSIGRIMVVIGLHRWWVSNSVPKRWLHLLPSTMMAHCCITGCIEVAVTGNFPRPIGLIKHGWCECTCISLSTGKGQVVFDVPIIEMINSTELTPAAARLKRCSLCFMPPTSMDKPGSNNSIPKRVPVTLAWTRSFKVLLSVRGGRRANNALSSNKPKFNGRKVKDKLNAATKTGVQHCS